MLVRIMDNHGQGRSVSGRIRPVRSVLSAGVRGIAAGLAVVLIYVLILANIWPQAPFVSYVAFGLVMGSALATGIVSVWTLRRGSVNNRLAVLSTVFIAAMAIAVPASLVRLVPPSEVTEWLSGLIDASTPFSASLVDLNMSRAPILSDRLVAGEVWIALVIEIVLVAAVLYVIAHLAMRRNRCITCRSKCELKKGVARRLGDDLDAARKRLKKRDWSFFRSSGEELSELGPNLRFDLTSCPACGSTNTLTVVAEHPGNPDIPVVTNLPLSRDDAHLIKRLDQSGTKPAT